jgi:protein ImuB
MATSRPAFSRSFRLLPASSPAVRSRQRGTTPELASARSVGTAQPARELWLAIHLPHFMFDALGEATAALRTSILEKASRPREESRLLERSPEQSDRLPRGPIAVIDLERGGKAVCDCNDTAAEMGVAPGMAVNSALALVPTLQTFAREPRREEELLQALAEWSLRFTPRVSVEPPDAVLLEVRGSLRLFGGARRLGTHIHRQLIATGLQRVLSLTPTPLASLWIARAGEAQAHDVVRNRTELASRLVPLSLTVTRWTERSRETLATMGVRTVGECLRLPRDGFTRRFEPRMRLELDRALGSVADPRVPFIAAERFVGRRELEPEIAEADRLLWPCDSLLEELCEFLKARTAGIQSLEWRLLHRDKRVTRLRLGFAEPVSTLARISSLLRERLDRLQLPEPVRAVRLRSGTLVDVRGQAGELFAIDRRRVAAAIPQLLERLRGRLAHEAVHGLACVPEHRPESAWRPSEPTVALSPAHSASSSSNSAMLRDAARAVADLIAPSFGSELRENLMARRSVPRPLWLLDTPQPWHDDCLEILEGPECIESGWWDGQDVARDYYVARTAHGAWAWVFQNRRPGDPPGWFLHGWFG